MSDDTKTQIELAMNRFLEEVPALEPMKLVVTIVLSGRGDVQQFRVEMPGAKVTKALAYDSRVTVEMQRSFFNVMAQEAQACPTGSRRSLRAGEGVGRPQFLKLIRNVVERQQERQNSRPARKHEE